MSSVEDENSSTSTSSSSVTMSQRPILRASMLRPSAFSSQLFSKSEATKPATPADEQQDGGALAPDANKAEGASQKDKKEESASENAKPVDDDHLTMLTKNNGLAKSNPFTAVQVTPLSSSSGFVFGQNVRDRVTGNVEEDSCTTGSSSSAAGGAGEMNGNLLFSAAIPKAGNGEQAAAADEDGGAGGNKGAAASGKSLSDVAREYEENKNARKRKFEEVETFTGEEDEINVLDVTCKLYTFVASVYEERGRGSLRLNDPKKGVDLSLGVSRLVFRTAGSLRVLLNTKIWPEMNAERASPKSLRLTAIDTTGQVKVYLVMARPNDIQSLAMALQMRIEREKERAPTMSIDQPAIASATNGGDDDEDWDDDDGVAQTAEANVTPDLIADTEKGVEELVVEHATKEAPEETIVTAPACKKPAIEIDGKPFEEVEKEQMEQQQREKKAVAEGPPQTPDESTKATE